jgi:hypothetical protein
MGAVSDFSKGPNFSSGSFFAHLSKKKVSAEGHRGMVPLLRESFVLGPNAEPLSLTLPFYPSWTHPFSDGTWLHLQEH